MEEQKQPTSKFIDCTGHFYGSRVSKSGQYLNVYVVAEVNGKAIRVCIPTPFTDYPAGQTKPFAVHQVVIGLRKGAVTNIPLFTEKKEAKPEAKPEEKQPQLDETIPF